MILLLDTSTGLCRLTIIDANQQIFDYQWQADRDLARDLLAYLRDRLAEHQSSLADIKSLAFMRGPGSFTGLRIGATIMNTLAGELKVPIVGQTGDNWQQVALRRLESGQDDKLVLPEYSAGANITSARK